ncbi:hypothetical protein AB0C76_05805 [Kitasatospora sp. NPDC048722]|uniref:Rv1733c family protein n=1 Tax=Kitasatospora sp. NPDC048722 TaxID=3155639 RepID=UPI0033DB2588
MITHTNRRNPVRRTSDRVQWWLARILLAVVVAGLPAAAVSVGLLTYHAQVRTAQLQSAARHTVTARLTTDAAVNRDYTKVPATAAWTAPDGTGRTATVQVWPGEPAGTQVPLWVDDHGTVVSAPITRSQAATAGWTAAAAAAGSVSLLCLTAWKGTVRALNHHRYAQWEAEWNQVEPRWSKRLPN